MKTKLIYILIAILSNSMFLRADDNMNEALRLKTTPPSPDAAALGKYGQYPVSMSNGLVQIDIPIYTISLPQLKLPVSISYHASGIKVDEISTTVGLGWALNAGGVITRSVRGMPDENFGANGMINGVQWIKDNFSWANNDSKSNYLFNRYNWERTGAYDSESDIYFYNACGMSGSFRYDKDGNLVQVPLTNNQIQYNKGSDRFEITGNDGTVYTFADKEKSYHYYGSTYSSVKYTSSWYISGIKTIDGREISFNYNEDKTVYTERYPSYCLKVPYRYPIVGESIQLEQSASYTQIDNTLMLRSITFPEGSVNFSYGEDRKDRRKYRLTGIDIKNKSGALVRGFTLEHSYFTPTGVVTANSIVSSGNYSTNYNYRLRLNKLLLLDSSRSPVANYTFDYNSSVFLPAYFNYQAFTSTYETSWNYPYFGQDEWGYYNGVTTNKNLFTYEKVKNYDLTYAQANRSVNPTYAQACILKKITYPTGGYTEFQYEGNKQQSSVNTGGLRIQTVVSVSPGDINPIVRSYQYGDGLNNTTGWTKALGKCYTQGSPVGSEIKVYDYYSSQPGLPLSHSGGASVFYRKVTEFEGYPENSNGKTEHSFLYSSNDVEYSPPVSYLPDNFVPRFDYLFIDRGWTRGLPDQTKVYKKVNGTFSLVKRTDYNYTTFNKQRVIVGFKAFANFSSNNRPMLPPFNSVVDSEELFQYTDLVAETGLVKLTQVRDSSFLDGKCAVNLTTYSYDRLNNQYEPTLVRQINSDGSVVKKGYSYPKDINLTIYKSMADRNILSPVVITADSVDNRFLKQVQTNYASWHNTFIAPASVTTKWNTGTTDTEVTYHNYDSKGNPMYISKNGADRVVYLWSYNYQYPVVEVKGASYDEVKTALGNYGDSQIESFAASNPNDAGIESMGTTLRSYFSSKPVLVTVYTYKPLTGMSSTTDPAGVKTSYAYDDFGRLKQVLVDGKKETEYLYHYKE